MNLTLIRGLPGSGKSTLAYHLTIEHPCAVHLEADMFFELDGDYKFDSSKLSQAHEWCRQETIANLKDGFPVFVSNTFTTLKELKPYFDIAKMFDIKPTVILCQNDWGSVHNVPEETMLKMKKRFQYDITELLKD